ncbi:uncharacterized protein LOC131226822 [Magnolia sinica]|uniref:uncharacterized protein LOC131226822 n=1 Tax=Magnolia sinica TaxID=86752 RepID=UPI002658F970|nr:uncharacterized protein LOC131226822 [Magnolia sinica]
MDSILVWNIRGIGNQRSIRTATRLINSHKSWIVVILEPMIADEKRVKTGLKLGFHSLSNVAEGDKIWLFYQNHISASIIVSSSQSLTLAVNFQQFTSPMYLTFVYASCDRYRRTLLWQELSVLSRSLQGMWAVSGDFNAVTDTSERRSRSHQSSPSSEELVAAINDVGLMDVGFVGPRFTWCNNQAGASKRPFGSEAFQISADVNPP